MSAPKSPAAVVAVVAVLLAAGCGHSSPPEQAPEPKPRFAVQDVAVAPPATTSAYAATVLGDSPAGYWRLGDVTGTTAVDSSPAHVDGTYIGTYSDSPPPILNQPGALGADTDGAAYFYLSNSKTVTPPLQSAFVNVPANANQAPSTPALSLEAWFTMAPGLIPQTYSAILSKTTNLKDGYGIYIYSGTLYFYINNLNIRVGVPVSAIGNTAAFHHVVGVYDGDDLRIYIDGALEGTLPLTPTTGQNQPINAGPAPLQIGKGWTVAWQGSIDEAAVYTHALTAQQVLTHYQLAHPPGPVTTAFAAYAEQALTLGAGDEVVGGNVGVAATSANAGAQLAVGSMSTLDPARSVFAPSVSLASGASAGDLETYTLTNAGGTFTTEEAYPASTMPPLPLTFAGTPGTTAVTVATGKAQTLSPGSYGALTVNGTANLSPGAYSFSSVALGNSAKLVAEPGGLTTVFVSGSLSTGTSAQISPYQQQAGALAITVSGTDGANASPPAVSIGASTTIAAVMAAPRGTIAFGSHVTATGAFAAFTIAAADSVTLTHQSGFPIPQTVQPPGQQPSSVYTLPPPSPIVGVVPPSTAISFELVLPVRDLASLQFIASQASNPTSADYRHYLAPADFLSTYAPTAADYGTLVSWAQSNQLTTVSHPHNIDVAISGTAAQLSQALSVNFLLAQRPDGTVFYEPDRLPSVNVPVTLLAVRGIDNYFVGQRADAPADTGSGNGSYMAKDLRAAYVGDPGSACAPLDGTGQYIGLIAGSGFSQAAIDTYTNTMSITDAKPVKYQMAGVAGKSAGCPTCDNSMGVADPLPVMGDDYGQEIHLDIEMALAMAPHAQVIAFEATDEAANLSNIVANPQVHQISTSFGVLDDAPNEQYLTVMAAQGQSFFAASHDYGAYPLQGAPATCASPDGGTLAVDTSVTTDNPPQVPASAYVTAVGGTDLQTTGPVGPWLGEMAWVSGGGGVATSRPRPPYQMGLTGTGVSATFRNLPDVSALGSDAWITTPACNGYIVGNVGQVLTADKCALGPQNCDANFKLLHCIGQEVILKKPIWGTSVASPLWAGYMALVNQKNAANGNAPVGFANPLLYQIGKNHPGAFHDAVGNANTNACGFGYTAEEGYDLATGWGTPSCDLMTQLVPPPQVTLNAEPTTLGPIMCMYGTGFTIGGTVTVEYAGVPFLPQSQLDVITTSLPVAADGTVSFTDNEASVVYDAVQARTTAYGCTGGNVTLNLIDNTTGVSTTATMPQSYWCQIGNQYPVFGAGCQFPTVTIRYEQFNSCNVIGADPGEGRLPPNLAYVAFGVEDIENPQGTTPFNFEAGHLYVSQGAQRDFLDPTANPIFYRDVISSRYALPDVTIGPESSSDWALVYEGATVVSTTTADGPVEASATSYPLLYKMGPGDPWIELDRVNPQATPFTATDDCLQAGISGGKIQ